MPNKTPVDDSLFLFYCFFIIIIFFFLPYFSEKIRLGTPCELSVRQIIYMKCQTFSEKE